MDCSSFRPVGGCHLNPRVQASIPPPAPHIRPGQNDLRQRPGKGSRAGPGVIRPPGQRRHRARGPSVTSQRVLFNVFSRDEKNWRISPNTRPQRAEQIYEGHSLPHVDHGRRPANCGTRGMVHIHRPQRCLFPHPYRPAPSAVSPLCLSRPPLAVQGTTFWALPLPKGVHEVCGRSPCASTVSRPEGSPVPGRLADLCPRPCPGVQRYSASPVPRGPPRTRGKHGKELPGTISGHDLHRGGIGQCSYDSQTVPPPGGRHPSPSCPVPRGPLVDLCLISSSLGQTNVHFSCGSSRLAVTAPPAEVAEQLPLGCQAAQGQETQGVTTVSPRLGPMEGQGLHAQGCSYGFCSVSQGDCYHRCLPYRMGCSVAEQDGPGAVVCGRSGGPHQCAGAASDSPGSQALSAAPEGQACSRAIRQHISCVSYKSSGRHQVCAAAASGRGAPYVGSPPPDQPSGDVSAGRAEQPGGLSLSSETSARRVAPPPGGGEHDLEPLRQGRGGPLRFRGLYPLSPVVLLGRDNQSFGPGCTGSSLAGRPSVRLSSACADSAGTSKGPSGGSQCPACGSLLAREELVSTAAQTLLRCTVAPTRQEGSPVPTGRADLAPQSTTPPAMCLAVGGPEPLLSSCADPVRHTIMSARAPSTRLQYENRWKLFSNWCAGRNEDPVHCSVPTILDFLQSLLDEGRSHSTLKVYVAAISCGHVRVDNGTVGSHGLVSLFLRGAQRLHPQSTTRAPAWDLPLVLDALRRPPFEPLAQAELKWVSCKTAFLLAICSAKRVSELHALSISDSCLRWNSDGSGVTLWPNTAFLPKVLSRAHQNQPIRLARFDPSPGERGEEPELLCPVRALEVYTAATACIRRADQLFLCYGGPNRGRAISKQRLSHWIVDVITHAYQTSNRPLPPGVRCHSTRSVATSWAALRGVSLEDICAAASWASPDTFSRFYRVNVATPHPLAVVLRPESSDSAH